MQPERRVKTAGAKKITKIVVGLLKLLTKNFDYWQTGTLNGNIGTAVANSKPAIEQLFLVCCVD